MKHRIITLGLLSALLILTFHGCKKDILTGPLDAFEGRYKWEYSHWRELGFFRYEYYSKDAEEYGIEAEIEFTDRSEVIFYIDGEELIRRRFKIKETETVEDRIFMEIKVDVPRKTLDINDKLNLELQADTLTVRGFPSPGYIDEGDLNNVFYRQ